MGKTNMKANVLFGFILLFTLLFSFVFTQEEYHFRTGIKIGSANPPHHCLTESNGLLVQGGHRTNNARFFITPVARTKCGGGLRKICTSSIYYIISNWDSKKVLEVKDNSKQNGGEIQLWNRHNDKNQQWKFYLCNPKLLIFYIKNRSSGKCLTNEGGIYQQKDCDCKNLNRVFYLVEWRRGIH